MRLSPKKQRIVRGIDFIGKGWSEGESYVLK